MDDFFSVPCTLVGRRQETPDAWTVLFDAPKSFRPKAGQFAAVRVGETGLTRCWTVSQTPESAGHWGFTVRCVPDGVGSRWITKDLPVGASFRISEPMGDCTLEADDEGPFLLLCAGIGVTPIMAIAREVLMRRPGTPVTVVQCAQNQASLVFGDHWRMLAQCRTELTYLPIVKEDPRAGDPCGRLTKEKILELCPDVAQRSVFTCGSAGFMASVTEAVLSLGADPQRVKREALLP